MTRQICSTPAQHTSTPGPAAVSKPTPIKRSHEAGEASGPSKRRKLTTADAISRMEESVNNLPQGFMHAMPPDTPATRRKALKQLFREHSLAPEEKLKLSDLFRETPSLCDQYIVMCEVCDADVEMGEMKTTWLEGLLAKPSLLNQQPIPPLFGNQGRGAGSGEANPGQAGRWQ